MTDFNDEVNDTANLLTEMQTQLDAGDITEDEFKELSADLIQSLDVDKLTKCIDNKRTAKETVEAIQQIVSVAISIAK